MFMLYNSDSYTIVQFPLQGDDAAPSAAGTPDRGGLEIVDKRARREVYLHGELAEAFRRGAQALVEQGPGLEALDDYIADYLALGHQPVVLH